MKYMIPRRLLAAGVAAAAAALCMGEAAAQAYPAKPIRFFVGFPAGSGTDTVARIISTRLSERLSQQVVVDNKSGAGGAIGVDAIAKSAPDGYTIGFGHGGSMAIAVNLRNDLPYDPVRDLAPVSNVANNPLVLVAHPSVPAKSVTELIAYAKANPGKAIYGSAGTASSMHLAGALLGLTTSADLVHAPYKGNAPALNDLLGGQIPLAVVDLSSAYGFIKQGRLKAIGTTGAKRAISAPEIPTIGESGVPGYAVNSWYGVVAPAKTPPEVIRLLNSHVVAILQSPDVRERFLAAGPEPDPTTPEEFAAYIKSEIARWGKVIKAANIVVQ